jgi:hypothetical protein
MIYAQNPKNCTKYTNYIMQNKKKKKIKIKNQNLKLLNHKDLVIEKNLTFKKIK